MGDGTCDDSALAYLSDPDAALYGWVVDDVLMCVATIKRTGAHGELVHIATAPEAEHRGFARALIEALVEDLGLVRLVAETDDAAVGFYRHIGFATEALDSPWPTPRFRCILACT